MKVVLHFDTAEEFGLFICSAASMGFKGSPMKGAVDLGRYLPTGSYSPFLDKLVEVHIGEVVYTVAKATKESPSVECEVVNYMLNDVQMDHDSIWVTKGGDVREGSLAVREVLETLPKSFLLKEGWRTDYEEYVFYRQ